MAGRVIAAQECFDIIGDVHGCYDALERLCRALGYDNRFHHPDGRILVFVGDLINRGPDGVDVLRLVIRLVHEGRAKVALGNHDDALLQWLRCQPVDHHKGGLDKTIAEIDSQTDCSVLKQEIRAVLESAALYLVLDNGALIVAHAGIEQAMIGKYDTHTRQFVLNGDAIGKTPDGKTLRRDWAAKYNGRPFIVYGHTPQERAEIRHNTVNIDTGAYRGGLLTAFRWPEQTLAHVASRFRFRA